jgi:hypothetical protein
MYIHKFVRNAIVITQYQVITATNFGAFTRCMNVSYVVGPEQTVLYFVVSCLFCECSWYL